MTQLSIVGRMRNGRSPFLQSPVRFRRDMPWCAARLRWTPDRGTVRPRKEGVHGRDQVTGQAA